MKTVVIVGFRLNSEKSVFYRKVEVDTLNNPLHGLNPKITRAMGKALEASDFISVRIINKGGETDDTERP